LTVLRCVFMLMSTPNVILFNKHWLLLFNAHWLLLFHKHWLLLFNKHWLLLFILIGGCRQLYDLTR
jgi:hypothetical protein